MKKSLLLALAFVAVCGYVMADGEDTTTPAPTDATTQAAPAVTPAPTDDTTQAAPADSQQDDELDMDSMLGDETTDEAK